MSGYRDKDTLKLKITEDYLSVAIAMVDAYNLDSLLDPLERFRVNIPMNQVVSAKPFDPEIYHKFQELHEKTG